MGKIVSYSHPIFKRGESIGNCSLATSHNLHSLKKYTDTSTIWVTRATSKSHALDRAGQMSEGGPNLGISLQLNALGNTAPEQAAMQAMPTLYTAGRAVHY